MKKGSPWVLRGNVFTFFLAFFSFFVFFVYFVVS